MKAFMAKQKSFKQKQGITKHEENSIERKEHLA